MLPARKPEPLIGHASEPSAVGESGSLMIDSCCGRPMPSNLKLISTDFDGTIHEDFADSPVPEALQARLAALQLRGVTWVINTGRDLASLMESLGRARVTAWPDYVVTVEREIFRREHGRYSAVEPWNTQCLRDHAELFGELAAEIAGLMEHFTNRFDATFYDDAWSPLCAVARTNSQMDAIQAELEAFCRDTPDLVPVRNDVYVRLSHRSYSKGTALAEIARRVAATPAETLAAGDHLNDLPMLRREHAHWLVGPANSVPEVRAALAAQGGYLATQRCGHGLIEALDALGLD
jgi:HAD superfamily hydrolase (TIGR01484 family)